MGTTTFYGYPYPDPGTSVDVPRDIKALADKLELMKNGLTIPNGSIQAGAIGTTTQSSLMTKWLVNGKQVNVSLGSSSEARPMILVSQIDGLEFRIEQDNLGQVHVMVGSVRRPIPFATEAGLDTIPTSGTTSSSKLVTFTTGRFTQQPMVFIQPATAAGAHSGLYQIRAYGTSITSFTAVITTTQATFATAMPFNWFAVQMTTASGAGLLTAEDKGPMKTVVCHTDGCANENVPIDVSASEETMDVGCGPCGQPIDDIKTKRKR